MAASAISAAAIALYRRYDGDLDGLSRSADRGAVSLDDDWRVIDDLRQRAFIIAMGRGSEAFARKFESDLATRIPDEGARREFEQLIDADVRTAAPEDRQR